MATFSGNAAGYRIDLLDNGKIQVVDIDVSDGDTGKQFIAADDHELHFSDRTYELPATETPVNADDISIYGQPHITGLAGGGYVVTWSYWLSANVYTQLYDAAGNPLGEEQIVNTTPDLRVGNCATTALPDGGYLVTWFTYNNGGGHSIAYAQRYDATGNAVGDEIVVDSTPDNFQTYPAVATLTDGGYVIAWAGSGAGDYRGIFAQRYDAAGNEVGAKVHINATAPQEQAYPSISAMADGGYVVSWNSNETSGNNDDIYAQRFDAAGNAVGDEIRVNTTTYREQGGSAAMGLADGGFIIAWSGKGVGDGHGVFTQRYDSDGNAVGGETRVNTTVSQSQGGASITTMADGGYLITWTSNSPQTGGDIFAQRYDAAGHAVGGETRINVVTVGNQYAAEVTALTDGSYIVTWLSDKLGAGKNSSDIYTRRFDANGEPIDGKGEFILTGTADDDVMNGGFGNQILVGGDGDDTLYGGSGDDALYGEAGRNTLYGGAGDDELYAGLEAACVLSGGSGDDALYGGEGADLLSGGAGDDILCATADLNVQSSANDVLNGGTGDDILYGQFEGILNGGQGNDTLYRGGIINGGDGNDTIYGADASISLNGGDGNDEIHGGYGQNALNGGDGNDRLDASYGDDVLDGGRGNDTLDVGSFNVDTVRFTTAIADGNNVDTVFHFAPKEDMFELSAEIFDVLNVGVLAAENFRASGGNAADADDYILYDTLTGELFYDADGSGAGEKVQFAVIGANKHPALTAANFEVV